MRRRYLRLSKVQGHRSSPERLETSAPKAVPIPPPVLQGTPVTVSSLQSHLDAIRQAIPEVTSTTTNPSIKAVKVLEVCPAETKGVEEADRTRPRAFWTQEPPMR